MGIYLLKKIIHFLIVLSGISIIVFFLLALSPGDPVRQLLISAGLEPSVQNIRQLREEMGFNQPLWQQYLAWAGKILAGDWGHSYRSGQPVLTEILDRVPATLLLAVCSVGIALFLSVPLAIMAALQHNKRFDHISRGLSLLGSSLPGFWLALLLIYCFSVKIKIFPATGSGDWRHLVLPTLTLALGLTATYSRFLRTCLLEVLRQDYILAARARGISSRRIWLNHILRTGGVSFLTVVALNFTYLLGGSVIVEKIFAWPGLGKMVVDAIFDRNYPVVQGYILFWATGFVLFNLLTDLACTILNPRPQPEKEN